MTTSRTVRGLLAGLAALTVGLTAGACSAGVDDGTDTGSSSGAASIDSTGSTDTPGPSDSNTRPDFGTPSTSTTRSDSTSPDPGTPTGSSQTRAPLATAQETLSQQLGAGEDESVVTVPGGYDGVVFDNVGHLRFFRTTDGVHWTADGPSTYRYDARDAAGQHLKVTGALLDAMTRATFILHGTFSGDGSGNAMAYTVGESGWGPVLRRLDDGTRLRVGAKLPSQDSTTYQVSYRSLSFSRGYLVEKDCSANVTNADCGAPGTTYTAWWLWDKSELDFRSAQ